MAEIVVAEEAEAVEDPALDKVLLRDGDHVEGFDEAGVEHGSAPGTVSFAPAAWDSEL